MSYSASGIKENLVIGKISTYFGSRYGTMKIDRLLGICGIKGVPEGSKAQKISFVLRNYYDKDRDSFAAFLETLLSHHELAPKDKDELNALLQVIGYQEKDGKILPSSSSNGKEIILSEGKPYDVFRIIEKILLSATNRLLIIDAYVDDSLFTLFLDQLNDKVAIRILTKKPPAKFEAVGKKFKVQGRDFEVRVLNGIHDRQVIVDNRAWVFGQSIKDAGSKPLCIVELENVKRAEQAFLDLWGKGTIIV